MNISVVIPAYNEEKYLPKTLESLDLLERKPDEVIVIDGGSADKTVQIAKSFGAKVVTDRHRGIGYARQKGLEAATGDVVAYTDADTVVPYDWLTKIAASLSGDGISGVYSWYKISDGKIFYRFIINYGTRTAFFLSSLLGSSFAGGQNIAFWKAKGIKAGGFPVDFKSVEDFEMIRRLRSVGGVVYRDDNFVISSGRRGDEGTIPLALRVAKGLMRYFLTGKADTFTFPDIR